MEQNSNTYHAIIFDLDGTLVNTGPLIEESFRYTFSKAFKVAIAPEELTSLVGIPLAAQMLHFAVHYYDERTSHFEQANNPDELAGQLIEVYREYCAKIHDDYIEPFEGITPFIEELKKSGAHFGVATSKRHQTAVQDLDHFGLYKYFDVLIGADDVSEHKPKPMPLLKVLELLNTQHETLISPAQCIYVGDSPYDIQAAKAAGMMSVGAGYGMFSPELLIAEKPNLLVQSPAELNQLLNYLSVY